MLLAPLIPLIWWFTWREALKSEEKFGPEHIARNKEAAEHVLSRDVLFGKSLIICAQKVSSF